MPVRGPLARLLLGLGLVLAAGLAVAGGLALRPAGLLAVGLAAVVSGCLAGGVAHESRGNRRAVAEATWRAAGMTVAVLLVLSGTAVLGGTLLTLLVAGAGIAAWLAVWLLRGRRAPTGRAPGAAAGSRPVTAALPPVSSLATGELGREWVRTTAALAGRLDVRTRQAIVARRQETLDELERRDPAGFARWLAGTPQPGSDPTGHLRHGDPAP
ncbi:hypothetical protein DQ238_16180 [Geodermatophilus sp. TF02-6]|uniref:hypothetical protein n=1 Tax=Geodermatophilus sp. TF02-6 TaxID=2250575 RepID=UPI000DE8D811|nr:hypothetical protein [Geodermatophilus sp. TF02-6]RBY76804.1 hypothetical protein DQ238_16180 [Geodermatophilus sp. TF02-6]